jgi:hypothetical protein
VVYRTGGIHGSVHLMKHTTVSGYGLCDYDLEQVPANVVECWDNYTSGSYEGGGYILMLDEGTVVPFMLS